MVEIKAGETYVIYDRNRKRRRYLVHEIAERPIGFCSAKIEDVTYGRGSKFWWPLKCLDDFRPISITSSQP